MIKNTLVLISGIIFGIGLTLSSMTNPDKVIGFLDIFYSWDPSLGFVMAGAIVITSPILYFLTKNNSIILAEKISLPTIKNIDKHIDQNEHLLITLVDEYYDESDFKDFCSSIFNKNFSIMVAIKEFKFPDEYLKNYTTIWNWMMNKDASNTSAILTLLSSHMNPFMEIHFNAAFPIGLSEILFDSTAVEPEYKVANLTMSYKNYTIKHIKNT